MMDSLTPFPAWDAIRGKWEPQGIKHSAIWEYSDQSVLHSDVMQKGFFGVHNERVRNPE